MQRFLIIVGAGVLTVGLAWPLLRRVGFGHLPGDFSVRGPHVSFYFPLTTGIIVSVVLTLLLWLINR